MTGLVAPIAVVDVVIAAWNRVDTIERAILSVVDEPAVRSVIVVDDGSTDGTAERAALVAHDKPNMQVIRNPRNEGPSAARNRALAVTEAPWIAVLDGDDYMLSGRLSRLLLASGGYDLVADNPLQVTEGSNDAARPLLALAGEQTIDLESFVLGNLSRSGRLRQEMGFLKPILRRAFLERHGLRYAEPVRLGEDYLLYAEALARGARWRLLPEGGYVAVMRAGSLSGRHSRHDLEALREGARALQRLLPLTPAELHALRRHCRQLDGKIQWLEVIEAVKARAPLRFIRGFTTSPAVAGTIAYRLAEQLLLRTGALFAPSSRRDGAA